MPPVTPEMVRRTAGSVGSPKKSAFRTAVGRAPMAKTARGPPPTPVAAPWNGSIADGWLWLSTLNTQRSPPPRSTAPAFSPGPTATDAPRDGRVRSSFFECLYAQCSLHPAPNTAHASGFGSRPTWSRTRAASYSVRPASCGIWLGCAVFVVPKTGDALTIGRSLRATPSEERVAHSMTEAYSAYSPAQDARSGRSGRSMRSSPFCWSVEPKTTTRVPSGDVWPRPEPPARTIASLTASVSSFVKGVHRVVSAKGPAVGGSVSPRARGPTEKGQVALSSSIVGVAL